MSLGFENSSTKPLPVRLDGLLIKQVGCGTPTISLFLGTNYLVLIPHPERKLYDKELGTKAYETQANLAKLVFTHEINPKNLDKLPLQVLNEIMVFGKQLKEWANLYIDDTHAGKDVMELVDLHSMNVLEEGSSFERYVHADKCDKIIKSLSGMKVKDVLDVGMEEESIGKIASFKVERFEIPYIDVDEVSLKEIEDSVVEVNKVMRYNAVQKMLSRRKRKR
jgi:hypothetical protein